MEKPRKQKFHLSPFQIIMLCFAGVILLGAGLLMLPIASREGAVTPFPDTLFTATSAVCVTGLVVRDTASYWTSFGQTVILLLIQVGGLGVITVATAVVILTGKRVSLRQRTNMQNTISAPKVGGIVRLTKLILKGTLCVELAGTLALLPVFCRDYGLKGIPMSIFHAISAFCNAGFDLLGTKEAPFVSLTGYEGDILLNAVIMLLIVIGGIGFIVWEDIYRNKFHFKRYSLQSKVALTVSAILIFLPALFFYFSDFYRAENGVLKALFQSVAQRTAGYSTTDLSKMSGNSQAIMIFLMLVGGSPGSTAGGFKTTTLAILIANAVASCRSKSDVTLFKRRVDPAVVQQAATLAILYFALFFVGGVLISIIEGLPLSVCLFETASAVGTVGLTLGITAGLGVASKLILVLLMFLGRIGVLTFVYAASFNRKQIAARLPVETITVG